MYMYSRDCRPRTLRMAPVALQDRNVVPFWLALHNRHESRFAVKSRSFNLKLSRLNILPKYLIEDGLIAD